MTAVTIRFLPVIFIVPPCFLRQVGSDPKGKTHEVSFERVSGKSMIFPAVPTTCIAFLRQGMEHRAALPQAMSVSEVRNTRPPQRGGGALFL